MISREKLLEFMRQDRYAVQASVSPSGAAQAALVGIVVSNQFEVFFDTDATSRKMLNLRVNPAIALVFGLSTADPERTVQLEGLAEEPQGPELDRLLEIYFARFPDGRLRRNWPNIAYVRVRPNWLRYSDYSANSPEIVEFEAGDLTLW